MNFPLRSVRGVIARRLLLNFRVRPDVLADLLPESFRPKLLGGTGMAGIALYGCLTRAFSGTGQVQLRHRLESVKILPPSGANDPDVYGAITQQAVSLAELRNPDRNRAICMAVTANSSNHGLPSSWSGAFDNACSGANDSRTSSSRKTLSVGSTVAVGSTPAVHNAVVDEPPTAVNRGVRPVRTGACAWAFHVGTFVPIPG